MGGAVQFSGVIAMHEWSTLKKLIWIFAAKLKGGASAIIETITGNLPLTLANALSHAIESLTRYGLCTQASTPTPSVPVDIMTNNGALKFGWYDIITTSALSGYGTYITPSRTAGNRAYKWLKDLPNGTYTFAVDGDYEIIVQWRDPADPSILVPSSYENLSGWMTSGEVVLDKESGGYGIAVKRASGTSSITPSNFDGTLHVQEQGIYTDGTSETLTVTDEDSNTQTASVPMLLSVGDYKDEAEIISGIKTGKVGVKVFDGTETICTSNACFTIAISDRVASKTALLCSHFPYSTKTSAQTDDMTVISFSSTSIGFRYDACADKTAFAAFLAAQYAAGTPVIVLYPLATETTEQTTAQHLNTYEGTTVVDSVANVSPLEAKVKYYASVEN